MHDLPERAHEWMTYPGAAYIQYNINDLPEAAPVPMYELPEAAYTIMTYRRPMIMDDLPEAAYTQMTYWRPLTMDHLPEAAYIVH
jgi:hypothetical protein